MMLVLLTGELVLETSPYTITTAKIARFYALYNLYFRSTAAKVFFPNLQDYNEFILDVNEAEFNNRTIYVSEDREQFRDPTEDEVSFLDTSINIVVEGGKNIGDHSSFNQVLDNADKPFYLFMGNLFLPCIPCNVRLKIL